MAQEKCPKQIGGWTVGSNGMCYNSQAGILAGKGHFKQVLIEHHWNNPLNSNSYV